MSSDLPARHLRTAAAVVVAAGLLAGSASCSDGSSPQSSPSAGRPAASDEASAQAGGSSLRSSLLPGRELAPLNVENPWRTEATRRGEPRLPAWMCQRVSLRSNGAVRSWSRSYVSAGTSTASQVVGTFADGVSARRAFGSLLGNARDCADELQARGREALRPPEPLTDLEVSGGRAGWGVVFSGPVPGDPDAAHIDAVVLVLVGDRVSVVSMQTVGQDYNYEAGQAPPELAGPVVAARLAAG